MVEINNEKVDIEELRLRLTAGENAVVPRAWAETEEQLDWRGVQSTKAGALLPDRKIKRKANVPRRRRSTSTLPKNIRWARGKTEIVHRFFNEVVDKSGETVKEIVKHGGIVPREKKEFEDPERYEARKDALAVVLRWWMREAPLNDDVIADRMAEFFLVAYEEGFDVTVERLAPCIGVTVARLREWARGIGCTQHCQNLVLKAFDLIHSIEVDLTQRNKIPVVMYIFRSKNYFQMKDIQETVLLPQPVFGDVTSEADMIERLKARVPTSDDIDPDSAWNQLKVAGGDTANEPLEDGFGDN